MKHPTSRNNFRGSNNHHDTTTALVIIALVLTGTAATTFSLITLQQLYWPKQSTQNKKKSNGDDDDSEDSKINLEDNDDDVVIIIETVISTLEKQLLSSSSSSTTNNNYFNNSSSNIEPITDALTPMTIQILTSTSNIVGSTKTANMFYHNLFSNSPATDDLQELFTTTTQQNFAAQSLKFGQMMKWTTTTLQYLYLSSSTTTTRITNSSRTSRHNNNPNNNNNNTSNNHNNIIQSMKDLGLRHIKYGVKLKHFQFVKRALLDTIRELDFSSISIEMNSDEFDLNNNNNSQQIGLEVEGFSSPSSSSNVNNDQQQQTPFIRPTTHEIVRAWESLIYVFVGYMGPLILNESPNESIIEYRNALENDLAAPAGGTATAISASQGVALLIMSIKLTKQRQECVNKLKKGNYESKLRSIMEALQSLAGQDMEAYCRVMVAVRQPPMLSSLHHDDGGGSGGTTNNNTNKNNNINNNKERRKQAIDDSLDIAATIPMDVVRWSILALQIAIDILPSISKSGVGDAGAGIYMIISAVKTGLQNIRINTPRPTTLSKISIKRQQKQKQREELITNLTLTLDWQETKLMTLLP